MESCELIEREKIRTIIKSVHGRFTVELVDAATDKILNLLIGIEQETRKKLLQDIQKNSFTYFTRDGYRLEVNMGYWNNLLKAHKVEK